MAETAVGVDADDQTRFAEAGLAGDLHKGDA
jgi:hypothetical protein